MAHRIPPSSSILWPLLNGFVRRIYAQSLIPLSIQTILLTRFPIKISLHTPCPALVTHGNISFAISIFYT